MRDSFIFYESFYSGIRELNPEDQLEIYTAIFEYQFEEKEPQLTGIKKAIWSLIKPQLDANNDRYENGLKGGRPKKDTEKEETKKTTGYKNKKPLVFEKNKNKKTNGYENKKPNDNDNDNVNDNENDNENENPNPNENDRRRRQQKKRFEFLHEQHKPNTNTTRNRNPGKL